jgi:aldose 1-epimerase
LTDLYGLFHFLYRYTLTNQNNITVRIINFGATITDILVPDRQGKIEDVNLGFDDIQGIVWL